MGGARGRASTCSARSRSRTTSGHAARRDLALRKGLKTKVGLTFRYSPAMRYMRELIADGFIGTPFIFNGYEQNSQWLDPMNPLRQVDPDADQSVLQVSSLEGYGAPIIDLAHLFVGSDLSQVVGTMRNFIPERMVRATGRMMRMNIDDGDIFLGEFANGALCSVQTSFVTVGNYPASKRASTAARARSICRLVEEAGICETLRAATPDQVEFRELEVPARCYPPGGSRAGVVADALLRQPGQQLHRRDPERRRRQRRGFRRRRVGAGSDQRRRAVVSRAALGVAAAGADDADAILRELLPPAAGERHVHRRPRLRRIGCPTGRPMASRRRADEMRALRRRWRHLDAATFTTSSNAIGAGDGVPRRADRRARERPLPARQPLAGRRRGDLRHRSR